MVLSGILAAFLLNDRRSRSHLSPRQRCVKGIYQVERGRKSSSFMVILLDPQIDWNHDMRLGKTVLAESTVPWLESITKKRHILCSLCCLKLVTNVSISECLVLQDAHSFAPQMLPSLPTTYSPSALLRYSLRNNKLISESQVFSRLTLFPRHQEAPEARWPGIPQCIARIH